MNLLDEQLTAPKTEHDISEFIENFCELMYSGYAEPEEGARILREYIQLIRNLK